MYSFRDVHLPFFLPSSSSTSPPKNCRRRLPFLVFAVQQKLNMQRRDRAVEMRAAASCQTRPADKTHSGVQQTPEGYASARRRA
jgi:hypothetical protein